MTRKKLSLYKERGDKKRQESIATIKFEDFSKIDGSGLKNNMTEEYGWSLRGVPICGEKEGHTTEKRKNCCAIKLPL